MKKLLFIFLSLALALPALAQFKNSRTNNLPYATQFNSTDVLLMGRPGGTNYNVTAATLLRRLREVVDGNIDGSIWTNTAAASTADGWPLVGEWATVDKSVNLDTLQRFKEKLESGQTVNVAVIGDSLATPADSTDGVTWGLCDLLARRIGLVGGYHRVGNFTATNGNTEVYQGGFTNGSTLTGGYYYDSTNYFGLVHPLTAGSYIEYRDAFYRNGNIPCDRIGVAWIANPLGGAMSVSNSQNGGAYSKLGDIDGYAATPTYRWTNWTVPLDSNKLKVQVSAGTNKLIGVTTKNTTATNGLNLMTMENPGASVANFAACFNALRGSLTNFNPDLVVFNLTDAGDIGEAAMASGLTGSTRDLLTNVPNSGVLFIGTHWRLPLSYTISDNKIFRAVCSTNGWAFFDTAFEAGSYQKQTNISSFMADSVHLNRTGSLNLASRIWSRLAVNRPAAMTSLTVNSNYYAGGDGTNYVFIPAHACYTLAGLIPMSTNLYQVGGAYVNYPYAWQTGVQLKNAYDQLQYSISSGQFGNKTNWAARMVFWTTNTTAMPALSLVLYEHPYSDAGTATTRTTRGGTLAGPNFGSNVMATMPWRTWTTSQNWVGALQFGIDATPPPNSVWLLGLEVKAW